ncbi:hypothetical protein HDU97_007830 [Phlyctochytrium planicorne]|nr:hypothetical protein HDU97_007830 [Phlyctochytrium planicorne]
MGEESQAFETDTRSEMASGSNRSQGFFFAETRTELPVINPSPKELHALPEGLTDSIPFQVPDYNLLPSGSQEIDPIRTSLTAMLDSQNASTTSLPAESPQQESHPHSPLPSPPQVPQLQIDDIVTWNGTQPTSPPLLSPPISQQAVGNVGILEFFWEELDSADMDETDDVKKERFQLLGYVICLDSFLYIFTILPIRIVIAMKSLITTIFLRKGTVSAKQKVDILKGSLLFLCSYMLEHVDASKVYHSVRGQATIKLYVIFNVLEICDKLCSAFGHDILDSLFAKAQTSVSTPHSSSAATPLPRGTKTRRRLGRFTHFIVALCYVFAHTMILFYQVMTLNVAVNSYNNALLTLLLSNQFVEIKGSVFKKFERENLFQLSCSDVVERFQLSVFLGIIMVRNFVELTGGKIFLQALTWGYKYILSLLTFLAVRCTSISSLATLVQELRGLVQSLPHVHEKILGVLHEVFSSGNVEFGRTLMYPALAVFGTEVIVDWLKHAFITKFNQISPTVYKKFYDSLCRDLAIDRRNGADPNGLGQKKTKKSLDQSPAVSRRIGFVSLPLACLVIRVAWQTFRMIVDEAGVEFFIDFNPPVHVLESVNATKPGNLAAGGILDEIGLQWLGQSDTYAFLVNKDARGWLLEQGTRLFGRALLVLWIYVILVVLKLNIGRSLVMLARHRVMKTNRQDTANLSGPGQFNDTPNVTPRLTTNARDLPLPKRGEQENGKGGKPHGNNGDDAVDAAARDEKLDRVDRFLMVKSRIV